MRLLVTGSRNWRDKERLWHVLDEIAKNMALYLPQERYVKEGLILVSGHARGVDQMAEEWYADRFPLETPELWRADWKKYGKRAGYLRNVAMVDTNPDLCVAFVARCDKATCPRTDWHGSHGVTHCYEYAETKDVPATAYWEFS